MKRYLIGSSILSAIVLLVYYCLNQNVLNGWLHAYIPGITVFFFFQSLVVSWMFQLAEKDNWENPIFTLGSVVFRLLTGMFFVLVLYSLKPENLKPLLLQFVIIYLVYLVFELFAVLPNLRRN